MRAGELGGDRVGRPEQRRGRRLQLASLLVECREDERRDRTGIPDVCGPNLRVPTGGTRA